MNSADSLQPSSLLSKLDVNTYFFRYQMTIDSPAHKVWHHMLNYHQWNPDHIGAKVERLAGNRNEEQEVILEYKRSGDGFAPPIVIETVKLIPNKKIVWALYAPDTGASNEVGFVDFTLDEMDGKTHFTYQSYGWCKSTLIGKDRQAFSDGVDKDLARILPALKAYVERA